MHAIAQPDSAGAPGLLVSDPSRDGQAAALRSRFGFARLTAPPRSGLYLELVEDGLQLRQAGRKAPGPIRIDFLSGALAHRLRYGGGRGQPLARAVGMKPGFSPTIWDATAGLGRDALVLAGLGSRVTLCERSPVLAALLEDALQRASRNARAGTWIGRMRFRFADSVEALAGLPDAECPDAVYLDPMYPPGKAGVVVKKDMRALQQLLGGDCDSAALLEVALATAARRVVVKRPQRAGWLAQKRPSATIESRNTRYDLYVTL
jgi:16S rRNA (guanine1516-N2)-methyltransferase